MIRKLFVVSVSAAGLAVACGGSGDDNPFQLADGGSKEGGSDASAGGSSSGGMSGSSGSAGSSSGGASGSGTGGDGGSGVSGTGGDGGSGGASGAGGDGGSGVGGDGGAAGSAGASGSSAAGAGGSMAGAGGTSMAGAGGSGTSGAGGASGGSGGSAGADACTPVDWCRDRDDDGYGDPAQVVSSCVRPPVDSGGGGWIQAGSKANACGDCDDGIKNVNPGASSCHATPYSPSDGGDHSFDYNCDGTEAECGNSPKASDDGCKFVISVGVPGCTGDGYLRTGRSGSTVNPYCGSTKFLSCELVTSGPGTASCVGTVLDFNPITCR